MLRPGVFRLPGLLTSQVSGADPQIVCDLSEHIAVPIIWYGL